MLKQWRLMYHRNELTDNSKKDYAVQVAQKIVWAEDEKQAEILGRAIASHDGTEHKLPINFDFIDVTEYYVKTA